MPVKSCESVRSKSFLAWSITSCEEGRVSELRGYAGQSFAAEEESARVHFIA